MTSETLGIIIAWSGTSFFLCFCILDIVRKYSVKGTYRRVVCNRLCSIFIYLSFLAPLGDILRTSSTLMTVLDLAAVSYFYWRWTKERDDDDFWTKTRKKVSRWLRSRATSASLKPANALN